MTATPARPRALCEQCGTELAPLLLACPRCGRLVHADELKRLAAEAERTTQSGDLVAALAAWRAAVDLLPHNSQQYDTVHSRIADLSRRVDQAAGKPAPAPRPAWAAKAGVIGVALLMLWKFKFVLVLILTKGKFLLLGLTKGSTFFSMFLSLSVYWSLFGWKWALGVVASIYVHEMGHVAMLARFGVPASAPMFIPGLGAVIRARLYPQDVVADARVGLAGPIWGLGAALTCYAVYLVTGSAAWGALTHVGALINLFNLLPVWQLDGARGFRALTRRQRWLAVGAIAFAWFVTAEGLLVLLLLVAVWAAWAGKPAERPDWRAFAEYAGLVIVLAALTKVPVDIAALR